MKSSITRRRALAAAAGVPLAIVSPLRAADPKPNIVYIMADDMGYADLSCYGRREYRTPNIDGLAASGVRFLQAYANSSVCSATRTALITGRYQYRLAVGLEEPILSNNRKTGLPPSHPTLPSLLKKVGYGTTLIGKWHLGRLPAFGPLQSGYDHFWGFRGGALDYFTHKYGIASTDTEDLWDDDAQVHQAGYLTDLLGDRAVKVIGDYAKSKQPFFLSLHFNAPHWPWEGPEDEAESRRVKSLFDFDGGSLKTYGRMVTQLDAQVGRVLKALETNGIAKDTIVIFTSDNGGERFSDTWPFTGKTGFARRGTAHPGSGALAGTYQAAEHQRSSRHHHGLGADVARGRRWAGRSGISAGWDESASGAYAKRRSGFTQIVLALPLQCAARHARRRHEMAQDQPEHIPV